MQIDEFKKCLENTNFTINNSSIVRQFLMSLYETVPIIGKDNLVDTDEFNDNIILSNYHIPSNLIIFLYNNFLTTGKKKVANELLEIQDSTELLKIESILITNIEIIMQNSPITIFKNKIITDTINYKDYINVIHIINNLWSKCLINQVKEKELLQKYSYDEYFNIHTTLNFYMKFILIMTSNKFNKYKNNDINLFNLTDNTNLFNLRVVTNNNNFIPLQIIGSNYINQEFTKHSYKYILGSYTINTKAFLINKVTNARSQLYFGDIKVDDIKVDLPNLKNTTENTNDKAITKAQSDVFEAEKAYYAALAIKNKKFLKSKTVKAKEEKLTDNKVYDAADKVLKLTVNLANLTSYALADIDFSKKTTPVLKTVKNNLAIAETKITSPEDLANQIAFTKTALKDAKSALKDAKSALDEARKREVPKNSITFKPAPETALTTKVVTNPQNNDELAGINLEHFTPAPTFAGVNNEKEKYGFEEEEGVKLPALTLENKGGGGRIFRRKSHIVRDSRKLKRTHNLRKVNKKATKQASKRKSSLKKKISVSIA